MKNIVLKSLLIVVSLFWVSVVHAREYTGEKKQNKSSILTKDVERCKRASSSAELNINNVRCRINATGNMWYDGSKAAYYVPGNGNSTALFCGALWIGGKDENEQLRVAALRFGQVGDDFWPGPLTADGTATTNLQVCNKWDKHYRITKVEVETFIANYNMGDLSSVPDIIKNWPAHGEGTQSRYIAPFFDKDGDGVYDYTKGDYPYYDFDNSLCPKTLKANLKLGEKYTPIPTMEDSLGTGYNPIHGGILSDQVLKGDQTIFWVFNDAGNAHTESKSDNAIGLEIRAQAFAFSTNDEINNMTFYSYEIINRSTYTIKNTYFSQWVDPDLGYAWDDFVGCDVKRGLGYCYNGKSIDGPGEGAYSGNPPAIGIDFFQGPYMDPDGLDNPKIDIEKWEANYSLEKRKPYIIPKSDGSGDSTDANGKYVYDIIRVTDDAESWYDPSNGGAWYFKPNDAVGNCAINGVNFGNGIVDDERFGMRRFVYHINPTTRDNPVNGEPDKASDYYNYLCGIWRNNQRMVFGGTGVKGSASRVYPTTPGVECDFMFPGDSDPWNWGTNGVDTRNTAVPSGWTEEAESNNPGDRRFMQSAGPFTLKPGAVNYITVGIPWAKASSGDAIASVELLRVVDDKCQALFDNCFKLLEGPDAPRVIVQELSNQVILYLENSPKSNNYDEKYKELDPRIPREDTSGAVKYDRFYTFEGYQIFQVKDSTVSVSEIYDKTRARLVAQCDIENYYDSAKLRPIAMLINYEKDYTTGALAGIAMVKGANKGIQHSFVITEDQFATGTNKKLVNNMRYYYIAVAYAQNNYKTYSPENAEDVDGQKLPYLAGRKDGFTGGSIKPAVAMPHDPSAENGGTIIHASYGESPEITRLAGRGNGGVILELQEESKNAILNITKTSQYQYIPNPVYKRNAGPLRVKIIDPLSVKEGVYNVSFTGVSDTSSWYITRKDGGVLIPASESESGKDEYVVYSDTISGISRSDERLFLPLGFSIHIQKTDDVATPNTVSSATEAHATGGNVIPGALLSSSIIFADNTKQWLSGFRDNDGSDFYNWIRSGNTFETETQNRNYNEASCTAADSAGHMQSDYYFGTISSKTAQSFDKNQEMEMVASGWWAPYKLCSGASDHPAFVGVYYYAASSYNSRLMRQLTDWQIDRGLVYNDMSNLGSVDIVITKDKSKWSRCPVVELQSDPLEAQGQAKKFQLRKSLSVDKEGNPINDPDHKYGMGWFPGYVINVETGERLNIFFGEDSRYGQYNGRDMMWNPMPPTADNLMGSKHFIYIVGNNTNKFANNEIVKSTPYDEGEWAYRQLLSLDTAASATSGITSVSSSLLQSAYKLFSNIMWVGCPLVVSDEYVFKNPADIPSDVTIKIRVRKSYQPNYTGNDNLQPSPIVNSNNPMYQFGIGKDMATETGVALNNEDFSNSLLDQITVVPNPYYAASEYEQAQLDTRIRITNLPANAMITIYTPDGTMVRRLGPSPANQTTLDWDLKNHVGIPIAGGVYLIHVKVPDIGETVIRWFGAMRPVDLNSYQF